MKKVPHCKECEHFKIIKDTFNWWLKNNTYECSHKDCRFNLTINRPIEAKYIKTSPSWCPKRNIIKDVI
jgi:hypothetical protein